MASKLSPSLKAAINRFGAPAAAPSFAQLSPIFKSYDAEVQSREDLAQKHWITLASATFFTLNTPGSLVHLWTYLKSETPLLQTRVHQAELMREVGLKCIGLIGVARIINELGILTAEFDSDVKAALRKDPTRSLATQEALAIQNRGVGLWRSIYDKVADRLADKLSDYHPDLPVYILEAEYGQLFSDPVGQLPVDRVLMSLVAVASLRSQEGVGPQVMSHVLGLKRAPDAGWLATDDGAEWALRVVEQLSDHVKVANALPKSKL